MACVREVQAGVWHWDAPHPDWKPGEDWGEIVSSYAIEDGDRLLLFDPLALPAELEERAAAREAAIVLTCPWHARDARSLVQRLGAALYVPAPDEGDADSLPGEVFRAGDRLPVGVEAFPGMMSNDLVLWVESRRALVTGDTLVDLGRGLELPVEWLAEGQTPEQVLEGLRPLLDLAVEHVLATHGGPTDRGALERALA
jgi:glyoxylase-like metal-dependent hydrolase (beta-lactamase superfamily II)